MKRNFVAVIKIEGTEADTSESIKDSLETLLQNIDADWYFPGRKGVLEVREVDESDYGGNCPDILSRIE